MNELSVKIYNMMDSMSTSSYDRPTASTRSVWTAQEYLECLVYQACRNLACEGQPFASTFDRKNLKKEFGRNKALHRIRSIIMLVINVAVNYTNMTPSIVIRRIEEIRPTKNPEWCPIPELERCGKKEKEWLIGIIMEKQGLLLKSSEGEEFNVKVERGGEDLEEHDDSKRAKTI
ncbi:hypothetical protein K458DRAFT_387637 [Lentithecium fluviatile CBS 122367]|uniref:Uncharacterized protein n=1 Tax=Lentithecium fluviatile CBS 122367 TaxID=1168545 RepID=A0A6G1J560_9PLEO|nr:hypothetical protein K458DRAFT_387637 [Lentithecium fluviatile CBS 122367]